MIARRPVFRLAGALVFLAAVGCGKKGDPLPPLRPTPGRVTDLAVRVVDGRLELAFTVPAANADSSTPSAIDHMEVYAMAVPASSPVPSPAAMLTASNRTASIAVRPAPAAEPVAGAPADPRPVPGERATWTSALPAAGSSPVTWYYAVAGVSRHRRVAVLSARAEVPLGRRIAPPADVSLDFTEREIVVNWTPGAPGEKYRVYAAPEGGREGTPLGDAPVAAPPFRFDLTFGARRCVVVRAVQTIGVTTLESEAAGPVCVTPVDRFPPPAPADLLAVPDQDGVTLVWTAVEAPDLAGYLVLRGEGAGDTLQPLTTAPLATTTFKDTTARAGVTYTYAVVAIDRATPVNTSARSNLQTVIAR